MTKRLDINDELLIHGRDAVLARDAAATVVHRPKLVDLAAARAGAESTADTRAPAKEQTETDTPPKTVSNLISSCASDITPEAVEWLWAGRLAIGKHTCIAGEPGTGKSQLSVAIIAAVTTGGDWPCGEGRAKLGSVIILSAEDGAADTIVPRLMAAGADLMRVHIVSSVSETEKVPRIQPAKRH